MYAYVHISYAEKCQLGLYRKKSTCVIWQLLLLFTQDLFDFSAVRSFGLRSLLEMEKSVINNVCTRVDYSCTITSKANSAAFLNCYFFQIRKYLVL